MADFDTDHIKGDMDVQEQRSTYALFGKLTKWGSLVVAVSLLFLVIWFAVTGGGFLPALITAIIVSIIGFFVLKEKPVAQ